MRTGLTKKQKTSPGCFASLRSEQGAVPLAPLCGYPCILYHWRNLHTALTLLCRTGFPCRRASSLQGNSPVRVSQRPGRQHQVDCRRSGGFPPDSCPAKGAGGYAAAQYAQEGPGVPGISCAYCVTFRRSRRPRSGLCRRSRKNRRRRFPPPSAAGCG